MGVPWITRFRGWCQNATSTNQSFALRIGRVMSEFFKGQFGRTSRNARSGDLTGNGVGTWPLVEMSIVLFHGGGAGDFNLDGQSSSDRLADYRHNVSELLRVRGHRLALDLFNPVSLGIAYCEPPVQRLILGATPTVGLLRYRSIQT
jgi:hypothetical protein